LPDKEFKVMVIKMFTELRKRMDEHRENFSDKIEDRRTFQAQVTELKSTVTELKNALEGVQPQIR